MKLADYINTIFRIEALPLLEEIEKAGINQFDDAVLMLDDLQDKSKLRNNEACYYIVHGKEETKRVAGELFAQAIVELESTCKERGLDVDESVKAVKILESFKRDVEEGQKVDISIQQSKEVTRDLLKQYRKMISLFTGGHIETGFELGFVLGRIENSYITETTAAGNLIGQVRQIDDDVADYKELHHEPLGDIVNRKKRLPELAFLLTAGKVEIEELNDLMVDPMGNQDKIRALVFNERVLRFIQKEVTSLDEKLESHLALLPEHYCTALRALRAEYVV